MQLSFLKVNDLTENKIIEKDVYNNIRKYSFDIMSDRTLSLTKRLALLGKFLELVSYVLEDNININYGDLLKESHIYHFP